MDFFLNGFFECVKIVWADIFRPDKVGFKDFLTLQKPSSKKHLNLV